MSLQGRDENASPNGRRPSMSDVDGRRQRRPDWGFQLVDVNNSRGALKTEVFYVRVDVEQVENLSGWRWPWKPWKPQWSTVDVSGLTVSSRPPASACFISACMFCLLIKFLCLTCVGKVLEFDIFCTVHYEKHTANLFFFCLNTRPVWNRFHDLGRKLSCFTMCNNM